MLRVTTTDGEVFTGMDAREIVSQMRNTEWNAPERKRDWMEEAAERATQQTGKAIRDDAGAASFLADLESAGLVMTETVPDEA